VAVKISYKYTNHICYQSVSYVYTLYIVYVSVSTDHWLLVFSPLVLLSNGILLFLREVVLDVERLTNVLRALAFNLVGNSLAGNVQETLDVQVVGSLDQFKEGSLVNLQEVLVPLTNVV